AQEPRASLTLLPAADPLTHPPAGSASDAPGGPPGPVARRALLIHRPVPWVECRASGPTRRLPRRLAMSRGAARLVESCHVALRGLAALRLHEHSGCDTDAGDVPPKAGLPDNRLACRGQSVDRTGLLRSE